VYSLHQSESIYGLYCCLSKWKIYQGYILCESSIVSQKWCKINTLLAQTTNRKCHMAYWIVPVAMTFEWPSRSAVASLRPYHNRNSSNIYATFAPRDLVPTLSLLSLYLLTISVRSSTGKKSAGLVEPWLQMKDLKLVFTARRYASAVYDTALCLGLS